MAIDISQGLPARAAATTARSPADPDKSRAPAPATSEKDDLESENAGTGAVDPARLAEVVRRANATVEMFAAENRGVRFEISEPTNHVVVTVIDEDEKRIVRQFPPEGFLKVAERLHEFRRLLVDEVA